MRKLLIFTLLASALLAQDVFRITPQRPIEELRREALAATPPQEQGKRAPELVEITTLDPTIKLDIRYATANNFLSTPVYEQARAFLQAPAAKALVKAHRWLKKRGYGLLIHDAYRPWYVTKIFWDATPPEHRSFVADPASGSRHNRGAAVDLTLYDLKTGPPVEMPSLYDEFSPRAYPSYTGGTAEQRRLRDLLREAMERHGFKVIENEWWHFDYKDWREYPILNFRFDEISRPLLQGTRLFDGRKLAPVCSRTTADLKGLAFEREKPLGPVLATITFQAVVRADGSLADLLLLRGAGRDLDCRAAHEVTTWPFNPARKDGTPVAVMIKLDVHLRRQL